MIASLAEAINDICCPNDNYGWASAGIYSFWDYYTNEILYIGLASDLYERFRQHNGLLPISHNACKYNQINDYFKSHMKLGFTIFVQSPMYQPLVHRNKSLYEELAKKEDEPCGNYVNKQGIDSIKLVEGILLTIEKNLTFRANRLEISGWLFFYFQKILKELIINVFYRKPV